MKANLMYDVAKKRFIEISNEWEMLGFWSRIFRGREFKIRLDTVIRVMKFYKDKI